MRTGLVSVGAVVAVLLLAGCQWGDPGMLADAEADPADAPVVQDLTPPAPPRPIGEPVRYHCAGGREFSATFDEYANQMMVTVGETTRSLRRVSGFATAGQYQRGEMAYWSDGPQASLTGFPGGPYDQCREG